MKAVTVSALSHDGLLRDHNEDSLLVGPWTACASLTHTPQTFAFPLGEPLVIAVADGLGGHPAGDVASTLVVQALARAAPQIRDEQSMRTALEACNELLYDEAGRDSGKVMMGTTVAGLVVAGETVTVFNVGDSRVYRFDGEELTQLSVDDNPPLARGETHTPILTQMLGGHVEFTQVDTHVTNQDLAEGARYLACTDGLSDYVDGDAITRILTDHRGGRAAFELWRLAMNAGGPDNITLALVEFEDV